MTDPDNMIHASGHTMTVAREPLREAIERIGYLYGGPTGIPPAGRRLNSRREIHHVLQRLAALERIHLVEHRLDQMRRGRTSPPHAA